MERPTEKYSALLTEISIQALRLMARSLLLLSSLSSHPLFSILATSFLLILIYLPRLLLPFLFSPVLISTLLLLVSLVRFGGSPTPETHHQHLPQTPTDDPVCSEPETEPESQMGIAGSHQKTIFSDSLFEWGHKAGPLEVIYEEYEGEEGQEEEEKKKGSTEYPRLPEYSHMGLGYLVFYDTDSDTESEDESVEMAGWDSPGNRCFRWEEEEEEEGEGLIEIALEEDNLIEIDISACR